MNPGHLLPRLGTLPCTPLPLAMEGAQRERLEAPNTGRCLPSLRSLDTLTTGGSPVDLLLCPCVSLSLFLDFWAGVLEPALGLPSRAPVATRHPIPTPDSAATTLLLLSLVFTWSSYLLPNRERRLAKIACSCPRRTRLLCLANARLFVLGFHMAS